MRNEEKFFLPSPRCGGRGKKFFAFPVLKLGNLQPKNPLFRKPAVKHQK